MRERLGIPERGRRVTQEPLIIERGLIDAPLATFTRRFWAFALDVLVFGVLVGACFAVLSVWSFHRDDPTLLRRFSEVTSGAAQDSLATRRLVADFLELASERSMAVPPDAATLLREDPAAFQERYGRLHTTIGLTPGPTRLERQGDVLTVAVGTDVLLGEFSTFFGWGAVFVGWFTLWTRVGRGRTLGKRLFGLRVVRLDGRPLRWWDAFARAGGYSASAATLLLGFIEVIWHPNRQALHDKVAGTVVLRESR